VIFPFENQPWEKALRLGLRDATESVGSQHAPVSERWFPYFPSRRDLAAGELPDRIRTIGPLWRRLFAAHGYPPERLDMAAPLRYRHLAELALTRARSEGEPATVVVAASIGPSDSLELLVKAVRGTEPLPGVSLRIKLHPKLGVAREDFIRDVLQVLQANALPSTVSFVDGPVADALSDADVLLYNTSSVSYEALAAGMPIVFVASDFWFDADPVPPGRGVGELARTPAEIRAAVERALREDGAAVERRRERARALLDDAFA
jgi:surface carbohydrate biosynthesis protein (TIGR04326 family)